MERITFKKAVINEMLSGPVEICPICGSKKEKQSDWLCEACFKLYGSEAISKVKDLLKRTKAGVDAKTWRLLASRFRKMLSAPDKPREITDESLIKAVVSRVEVPEDVIRLVLSKVRMDIEDEDFKRRRWETAIGFVEEQFPPGTEIKTPLFVGAHLFNFHGGPIPSKVMIAAAYFVIEERRKEAARKRKEAQMETANKFVESFFPTSGT